MRMWMAVLWGCGGDGEGDPTAPAAELTFVTYNAGLARGFVPGADSRQAAIGTALAGVDADVICLQEVWEQDQIDAIAAATAAAFPHSFVPAPQQSSDAVCLDGQLDGMLECVESFCDGVCTDQLDDCLLENCGFPFAVLPKDCQRCAMANVGSDAAGLVAVCEEAPVEFAYGGSFGTGILSKHPISSVEETVFASTSNRRSLLHAVIDTPEGPLDVYCTHLTAAFDSIPYPRAEGDWIAEQAAQIRLMNDTIDAAGAERVVLLGDMNTGPAVNGMDGETPENWAIFEEYEWSNPYLDGNPACTYCGDNPLIGIDDSADRVIDHVMLRGFGAATATRMLDGFDTTASSCDDVIDPSSLSDHYGVSVTATW